MTRVFDTNILIDYLKGVVGAREEFDRPGERLISIVTFMEVLAGAADDEEEDVIDMFLRDFRIVDISRKIARETVALRKTHRIRLPDAVIWSTARVEGAQLVTRDTSHFPDNDPGVRAPYTLTPPAPRRKASARRRASR